MSLGRSVVPILEQGQFEATIFGLAPQLEIDDIQEFDSGFQNKPSTEAK